MKIYLMRHGEAGFEAPTDDERELTENGRAKIQRQIESRRDELARVSLFLSSPLRRAVQTAQLTQEVLNRRDAIEFVDWLVHDSKPRDAIRALAGYRQPTVMLFSHQPFASHFVESLCGLEAGAIAMNTASVIAIEADPVVPGFGQVLWHAV